MIHTADQLLRGGACLLLALLAALVLRDHGRVAAAWLGSLFAAGTAAFALCSAPGIHALLAWWSAPILAGASGNNLVFWLFARALFDDGFRPRLWHAVLWLAIVAAGVIEVVMLEPIFSSAAAPLGLALTAQTVLFALLGGVQAVATWRGDVVEARRGCACSWSARRPSISLSPPAPVSRAPVQAREPGAWCRSLSSR